MRSHSLQSFFTLSLLSASVLADGDYADSSPEKGGGGPVVWVTETAFATVTTCPYEPPPPPCTEPTEYVTATSTEYVTTTVKKGHGTYPVGGHGGHGGYPASSGAHEHHTYPAGGNGGYPASSGKPVYPTYPESAGSSYALSSSSCSESLSYGDSEPTSYGNSGPTYGVSSVYSYSTPASSSYDDSGPSPSSYGNSGPSSYESSASSSYAITTTSTYSSFSFSSAPTGFTSDSYSLTFPFSSEPTYTTSSDYSPTSSPYSTFSFSDEPTYSSSSYSSTFPFSSVPTTYTSSSYSLTFPYSNEPTYTSSSYSSTFPASSEPTYTSSSYSNTFPASSEPTYTSSSYSSTFPASSEPTYTSSSYSSTFPVSSEPTYTSSSYSSTFPASSEPTYTSSSYSSTFSASSAPTYTSSSSSSSTTSSSSSYSTTSHSTTSTTSSSSSTTSSSSTSSAAPSCTDYWFSKIKHQGLAPFSSSPSTYKVFRDVQKDYGAKGDGKTDDTAAIQRAIAEGGRCDPNAGCQSTTTTPVVVYFPPGTYLVSAPIIDFYYTQIIGNPDCMPVLKASSSFSGGYVIDGSLNHIWTSTNIFWRQVRNFVVDMTDVPSSKAIAAFHWPTGQATSLQNIEVRMSTVSGNKHQGLYIEDGSGGFLTDMVFYGGGQGIAVGNQQFTMRNLTFHNCGTAIKQAWDWGWTYKGISINNCGIGLDISAVGDGGALSVGSVVFIDSEINNTPVGVVTGKTSSSQPPSANSLILENVRLRNVQTAVQGPGFTTLLAGTSGQTTIAAWGQGHAYGSTGAKPALNGAFTANARPAGLVAGTDFYERSKPQYEKEPVTSFVSIRDGGAKGDGSTDDTAKINAVLASAAAAGKIVFFDFGVYRVTGTIKVPVGSRIVGETYPVIMSSGAYFRNMASPKPVVQIGTPGSAGTVEWSDMIVSSQGAQAGAILIEWNVASSPSSPSGMWDVHTRVGGFAGSNLQLSQCAKTPNVQVTAANANKNCIAAFMSMHVTASASGLYMENVWLWVADHDVEDQQLRQITIYAGRGLLIESTVGNILMIGTAVEHHVFYEYQLYNTRSVVMGQIQTETAYYQPNPVAPVPFTTNPTYHDPTFSASKKESGWGFRAVNSKDVFIYGAGLYSFFSNNDVTCSNQGNGEACQTHGFSVENSKVSLYNLNTVGITNMITVNGNEIARYSDNLNGFVDTLALFRS